MGKVEVARPRCYYNNQDKKSWWLGSSGHSRENEMLFNYDLHGKQNQYVLQIFVGYEMKKRGVRDDYKVFYFSNYGMKLSLTEKKEVWGQGIFRVGF